MFVERNDWKPQAKFEAASRLAGSEFLDRLSYYAEAWLPARDLVEKAFSSRHEVHPSGRVMLLEGFAPWKVRFERFFKPVADLS